MIDYTKLLVLGADIRRLLGLSYLDFRSELNEMTGEVSNVKIAKYHFCEIKVYDSGTVIFSGSVHKLYNSLKGIFAPNYDPKSKREYKGYNGNLFTLKMFMEAREHLELLFACKGGQMIFQNVEFGVNCILSFSPQLLLKGLLFHRGLDFEFSKKGRYAQVFHNRYILKIYNKSEQYDIQDHTLRIEIKIRKTEHLKRTGIRTMADINKHTLNKAFMLLLKTFEDVVYYDYTVDKDRLNKRTRELLKQYSNPRYWLVKLKPSHRDRPKKKLDNIIKNHSDNIKEVIKSGMKSKCVMINRDSEPSQCVIINSSIIGLTVTQTSSILNQKNHLLLNQ